MLDARGIAQARWLEIQPGTSPPSYAEAVDRLGATALFVKPANLGSSIGISRVGDDAQWADALAEASGYDDTLIVEAAVDGRELSVSIIGNRAEGYEVSEPSETRPHGSFLDFDDKYGSDAAMAIVPAELDPTTRRRVRELGPRVARALRVDGLVRVDLFLTPTGDLLVNEVNTMPGFTAESTFPRMWAASGLDFPRLVDRLLELARRRHADTGARTGARTGAHTGARAGSAAGGITVRDATEADWARIGELTVAAYAAVPGRPSLPDYDRRLADTASRAQRLSLLVAEDGGGRVVGTVGYSLVEGTDGRVGRARQVAVDPGCKGLGIGRALMERAMLRLGEAGADEMIERTAEYMTDALAMYRALGFSRAPEWDEDQPDGPRLLAFRRRL